MARLLLANNVSILILEPDYPERSGEEVLEAVITGNLIFDARIVALCRDCGVSAPETGNRDFERFGSLDIKWLAAQ